MDEREDRGFLTAGSLASKITSSRQALGSALARSAPSSETTGEPPRVPAPANAIGRPRGATGVAVLPELRQALAELDSDKAGSRLQAWLRPLERSSLEPKLTSDWEVEGYRLTGPIEPRMLAQLTAMVETMTKPAGRAMAAKEALRCLALTKSRERDGTDLQLMGAALADELAEFPADVVATAFRKWARRETWWPSLAEIREPCLREMRWRRSLKIALEEAQQG